MDGGNLRKEIFVKMSGFVWLGEYFVLFCAKQIRSRKCYTSTPGSFNFLCFVLVGRFGFTL